MVLWRVLADELHESGEHLLLARLVVHLLLLLLAVEVVDLPQQGAHQSQGDLRAVGFLLHIRVEQAVQPVDVVRLVLREGEVEIAQVAVERLGHLVAHGHAEQVVAERHAYGLNVVAEAQYLQDAVGAKKNDVVLLYAMSHQVDV